MFRILGRVFGFWEVFGFWGVFWILGRVFGFWDVFRILERVFGFWEVFCPYEPPYDLTVYSTFSVHIMLFLSYLPLYWYWWN